MVWFVECVRLTVPRCARSSVPCWRSLGVLVRAAVGSGRVERSGGFGGRQPTWLRESLHACLYTRLQVAVEIDSRRETLVGGS